MLFAQRILASLAVIFVFCLPISAGAAAGRTPTAATVTPTGSSSYSIPIVVPPGVNGMTPSVALTYDSRMGNGVVGVGWGIDGLSAISRCPRTVAQDSEAIEVRLEPSDRFCLDGNKLRLIAGSGVYGGNGARYQTEMQTFSKITSNGTAGTGPASFLVQLKEGVYHYYGETADSRIESVGQITPRLWALNKIRDLAGNYITFTYVEDATNGSFRVAAIGYGGNELQGTVPTHSIQFVYETRPSNEIDSGYVAGSVVKEVTRLDRVDVLHGSTVLRRYELTYEGALSSTSKSRLASVQECAGSPLDCLPATTFAYQNGTAGLGSAVSTGVNVPTEPLVLDVDGDGRSDLVYSSSEFNGGVWMVMRANASGGYHPPTNTGVANTNYSDAIPIDYNADGREDLLVPYSGNTWWVMLGSSAGLAAPVNTHAPAPGSGAPKKAQAIDVNGDGLDDLVWADIVTDTPATQWNGGDAIRYRLREWGGTFSSTPVTIVGPTGVNSKIATPVFELDRRAGRRRTQDFNGDGRADIIYQRASRISSAEEWGLTVQSVGAWSVNVSTSNVPMPADTFHGDFNGDGKTDVLWPATTSRYILNLSTGATMAGAINMILPGNTTLAAVLDWDGDGYDDVLARDRTNGALSLLRSTGEGFADAVATGLSSGTLATVMDVNADGLPDLGYSVNGIWHYRLHAGVTPDLLQTATDGFGNYTTFEYRPLMHTIYGRFSDATYPSQDYAGSLPVVTTTTASNGIGGSYNVTYEYQGARVNLQGRGFEGFYLRRWEDSRSLIRVDEQYNRTFPYTGTLAALHTTQSGR